MGTEIRKEAKVGEFSRASTVWLAPDRKYGHQQRHGKVEIPAQELLEAAYCARLRTSRELHIANRHRYPFCDAARALAHTNFLSALPRTFAS
jgi:hypothetical protein